MLATTHGTTKTRCFDPFPFPACSEEQKQRIRDLGGQLDRHRKERQARHPDLTITGMYNVLEKLKSGEVLTESEREMHEKGLVSVLRQIHEELDRAVFAAYGWPADLADEEILERLVALNRERAEEERRGLIRWLRPEFQAPQDARPIQVEMEIGEPEMAAGAVQVGRRPWPKSLPERVQAVRSALAAQSGAIAARDLAKEFKGTRGAQVETLLKALAALGHTQVTTDGRFAHSAT